MHPCVRIFGITWEKLNPNFQKLKVRERRVEKANKQLVTSYDKWRDMKVLIIFSFFPLSEFLVALLRKAEDYISFPFSVAATKPTEKNNNKKHLAEAETHN